MLSHSKTPLVAPAIALTLLAGCANMGETVTPAPESLRNKVAGNLGFKPAEVTVSELWHDGGISYFVATTCKGVYGCSIPSGGLTAYATLGMVNLQPNCTKQ